MLISSLAIPLYSVCLVLVAVYTLFRLPTVDAATKILCGWIWLALFREIAGWYATVYYKNNLPVYNLSGIIEFVLIALYFHFSLFRLPGTWASF